MAVDFFGINVCMGDEVACLQKGSSTSFPVSAVFCYATPKMYVVMVGQYGGSPIELIREAYNEFVSTNNITTEEQLKKAISGTKPNRDKWLVSTPRFKTKSGDIFNFVHCWSIFKNTNIN